MAVVIIAQSKDPRNCSSVPACRPLVFREEDFPALPRSTNILQARATVTGSPTLAGRVRLGNPKVINSSDPPLSWIDTEFWKPEYKFHSFMKLPPEIPLMIWANAVRHQRQLTRPGGCFVCHWYGTIDIREYVKVNDNPANPRFLPATCFVSKTTKDEALTAFVEVSKFMIASIHDNRFLRAFLMAEPDRFALCRELSFDYFSRPPSRFDKSADLELAAQCTGLHTIKLTFHHEPLTKYVEDGQGWLTPKARSAEELFERFKLQRLLDCRSLKNITIERTRYVVHAAEEAAESLGELLELKFKELSPSQSVTLRYTRQACRRSNYYY